MTSLMQHGKCYSNFTQIIGDGVYQNFCNDGSTMTFDLFTVRSNLLPHTFVWTLYIYIGKMLRTFDISSKDCDPIELKHLLGASGCLVPQKELNENPRWPPQPPC